MTRRLSALLFPVAFLLLSWLSTNPGRALADCQPNRCAGPPVLHKATRLVCGVAVECDFDFYGHCGSSVTATTSCAESLLAATSRLYRDSVNVILDVRSIHVWTSREPFYYAVAKTEADSFKAWADRNLTNVDKNVSVLLAGRSDYWTGNYTGWTVGDVCPANSAASVARVLGTTTVVQQGDEHTLGHELGHALGAWHTFSCAWWENCYLSQPQATIITINNSTAGQAVEGGCCPFVTCDMQVCTTCDGSSDCPLPHYNCQNLNLTGELMHYGTGLDMHSAVKERIRQTAELGLPPEPITSLDASATCTDITLNWTSPSGAPAEYDLRTSQQLITSSNFSAATRLNTAAPQSPGSLETYNVTYGQCSGVRYYALKWRDSALSWSTMSNLASAATGCPHPPLQCNGATILDDDRGDRPVTEVELAIASRVPARGSVDLAYSVPSGSRGFELAIYDVAGRETRLINRGATAPGRFSAAWDLRSDAGERVRGGVYFARLKVGDALVTRSIVVLP